MLWPSFGVSKNHHRLHHPCLQGAPAKASCIGLTLMISLLALLRSASFLLLCTVPSWPSSLALPHFWEGLQVLSQSRPACSILLHFAFTCPPASQGLSDFKAITPNGETQGQNRELCFSIYLSHSLNPLTSGCSLNPSFLHSTLVGLPVNGPCPSMTLSFYYSR